MSSTEEESFIILEETPSLLEPYSLLQIPKSIEHSSLASIRTVDLMDETDNGEIGVGKPIEERPVLAEMSIKRLSLANSQTKESVSPNLAESFLLGAIDRNTMMNSVSMNFPSLVNSATKTEDIERLQSLMQEHNELKENLERSNVTMRQQFSLVNSWLDNVKGLKETHREEINELKRANSKLIDENKELKQKLDELQLAEAAMPVETVPTPATNESENEAKKRCAELEALVQNLQVELSNAIAEKLEYEDMKKAYIDEIDCVQVNLVSTEEMFKAAKAETMELKANNATLKQELETLEKALAAQKEQMDVINAQLEVYKTDFELERTARQEIAGQKEQLAADLQLLQRRNQVLLDESTERAAVGEAAATQEQPISISSSSASETAYEEATMFPTYTCPVCATTYANVDNLYRHVNECLEKLQ